MKVTSLKTVYLTEEELKTIELELKNLGYIEETDSIISPKSSRY